MTSSRTPPEALTGGPIPLNDAQKLAATMWAADDRLWTTQDTVEFNLLTFARVILDRSQPITDAASDRPQPVAPTPDARAVAEQITDWNKAVDDFACGRATAGTLASAPTET